MSVVPPATFRQLLGRLDAGEFEAFVADLWGTRGWETTREDGVVVSRGGAGEESLRLACVAPTAAASADPVPPTVEPDVVVSARDTPRVAKAAQNRGARYLGPEDLRTLLLYGLDREAAGSLFETHFGRPLVDSGPDSPAHRFRPTGGWYRAGAVLLGLVALTSLVLAVGPAGLPGGSGAGATATPAPVSTTPVASAESYPPGIAPSGVTDADALAAGHRRAVADRSYDLLVTHRGSVDLLDPRRAWATSRQTVDRVGPARFHYRVTGLDVDGNGSSALVVYDEYADGSYVYRRVASSGEPTYHRSPLPGAEGGAFTALGEAYVGRFLATSESRVERLSGTERPRFRVVATGSPLRIGWPLRNYTAIAIVGPDGMVHRLTVEYTRLAPGAAGLTADPPPYAALDGPVRFELDYRDVGDTRAPRPPWYDTARSTGNETVILRPGDSLWWTQPIGIDYDGDA